MVTIPEKSPISLIDDLVDRLGQSKIISVLELAKGYYQVLVHTNSVDSFCYSTGKVLLYRYAIWINTNAICFSEAKEHSFRKKTSAYIDDIAIFSNTIKNIFNI